MQTHPIERAAHSATPDRAAADRAAREPVAAPQRTAAPRLADAQRDEAPVAVPRGGRFVGLLVFRGRASVLGELCGDVVADGALRVGPEARVAGRIDVDDLRVEGAVEGDIVARGRVELAATATVVGAIDAPRVVFREGCRVRGRLRMPSGNERLELPELPAAAPDSLPAVP
ncbi:MAG: polymer-forming cytoskeletal protein [Myxococcota bacterium]